MTKEQLEELKAVLKEAMEAHLNSDEHRFVRVMMEKEKRNQEMWQKIQGNFIFWVLVSATAAIGWAVWDFFLKHVRFLS